MLRNLTLRNLATISDTSVEFGKGLNVLTGETGAGKSIIIDGLLLALGMRAERAMVRPGADSASVEAVFACGEDSESIVRREVRSIGKSRFFVNDQLSTLEEGRETISGLVDLHSQDSTPALLERRTQMRALDEYGGSIELAGRLSSEFFEYSSGLRRLDELRTRMAGLEERRDIAVHELALIDRLNPSQEDYHALMDERRSLRAVRDGSELIDGIGRVISGDDGMLDVISSYRGSLKGSGMESETLQELLEQAEIALSEADAECGRILSRIEGAPWRMEEIDRRLDAYSDLLGRCGGSLDSLLLLRDRLTAELEEYEGLEEELRELERGLPIRGAGLLAMGRELQDVRNEAAGNLQGSVENELRLLGMPHAVFRVAMNDPGEARCRTVDDVRISSDGMAIPEFRFSANPGMEPGPLSSVASGGEMSRVSLVLKLALSRVTQAPTMVFDEIDSGVGGETANLLADSLARVSADRQVIVITHLPQIASRAHHHLAVSKDLRDGMPVTVVRTLKSREDRVEEVSRLLGGGRGAREHAENMIPAGGGDSET